MNTSAPVAVAEIRSNKRAGVVIPISKCIEDYAITVGMSTAGLSGVDVVVANVLLDYIVVFGGEIGLRSCVACDRIGVPNTHATALISIRSGSVVNYVTDEAVPVSIGCSYSSLTCVMESAAQYLDVVKTCHSRILVDLNGASTASSRYIEAGKYYVVVVDSYYEVGLNC
jgi:hypothetical protein